MESEQAIIQRFNWKYGGNRVLLAGCFNNWEGSLMYKAGDTWTTTISLCPSTYQYKFIVDSMWCYDMDKPTFVDGMGNVNNLLIVVQEHKEKAQEQKEKTQKQEKKAQEKEEKHQEQKEKPQEQKEKIQEQEEKPQEQEEKSQEKEKAEDDEQCNFRMYNHESGTIYLFWINHQNEEVLYSTVSPGMAVYQHSYVSHKWAARIDNNLISSYIVNKNMKEWHVGIASIYKSPFYLGDTCDSEGPTFYPLCLKPRGKVTALIIFVDFPDAPALDNDTEKIKSHIIGDSVEWYAKESYQYVNLIINDIPGWRRMPSSSSSYGHICESYHLHKTYISDAVNLFPGCPLMDHDILYIVSTPNVANNLHVSPTWKPGIGQGIKQESGEIRHIVTFGADAYSRDSRVLCHETGHIFGLPDLYHVGKRYPEDRMPVSAWDIMSCVDCGRHFLGWHKYKLGWLTNGEMLVIEQGMVVVQLSPLNKRKGIKMIMARDPLDEEKKKAHIIELSQGIGGKQEWINEGVLVYSLNVSVQDGKGPINIICSKENTDEEKKRLFGWKYNAPLKENEKIILQESGYKLEVEVLNKTGHKFVVRVSIVI